MFILWFITLLTNFTTSELTYVNNVSSLGTVYTLLTVKANFDIWEKHTYNLRSPYDYSIKIAHNTKTVPKMCICV